MPANRSINNIIATNSLHRRTFLAALPALAHLGVIPASASASDAQSGSAGTWQAGLREEITGTYGDLESVLVRHRGSVEFEYYKPGSGPQGLRDIQSVTKSVLSLLVGIAVARGAIASLDQPVSDLLSVGNEEGTLASQPGLAVKHLLTMTAGYDSGRAPSGNSDNPKFLLARRTRAPVGTTFLYDNLAANLLSIVLESAVKQSVAEFARVALFEPIGVPSFEWRKGANGHHYGSEGLWLTTSDMGKLGELMLRGGRWGNLQLVPAGFVHDAIRRQNSGGPPVGLPYGYLWWVASQDVGSDTFFASGFGGQLIWVHRPLDLVVAATAPPRPDVNARGQSAGVSRRIARLLGQREAAR